MDKKEPVGWFDWDAKQELWVQVYPNTHGQPLYTAPPSKPWQSLTEKERCTFVSLLKYKTVNEILNAVEDTLRSKNT